MEKLYFFCVVAILKEAELKTRVRGVVAGTIFSSQGLVNFFSYYRDSKIKLQKIYLSEDVFAKRWKLAVRDWN